MGGHMGRVGTSGDVTLHQQYMADIAQSCRKAIDSVDLTPIFVKYGENVWAAFKGGLDEMARAAAAPVIEKYTGVLAAADAFTESPAFPVGRAIHLDPGSGRGRAPTGTPSTLPSEASSARTATGARP